MFTGIVEATGKVTDLRKEGSNLHMKIRSELAGELHVDQSLSHDGVCLTVTRVEKDTYTVTLVDESLKKSRFRNTEIGDTINLERSMSSDGRFDGHVVQGHVDMVGECLSVKDQQGSWLYTFRYTPSRDHVVVEKGSITINGISLTCFDCIDDRFSVAIIPYTYEFTNIREVEPGDLVNLEFDIIGKYVARILAQHQ